MLRRTEAPPSRGDLRLLAGILEEALAHIEADERQSVRHYAELERRLLDIENSRFLRTLQWPGRFLGDWKGRLGQALLHSPLHPLYLKLVNPHFAADRYRQWVETERIPAEWKAPRNPLISLVLPVHNPRHDWLEAAVGFGTGTIVSLLAALRLRRCIGGRVGIRVFFSAGGKARAHSLCALRRALRDSRRAEHGCGHGQRRVLRLSRPGRSAGARTL